MRKTTGMGRSMRRQMLRIYGKERIESMDDTLLDITNKLDELDKPKKEKDET